MKPLLRRACGGFSFVLPPHRAWPGRALGISLALHFLLFSSFTKDPLVDFQVDGKQLGRIQARIEEAGNDKALANTNVRTLGAPIGREAQMRRDVIAPSAVFAKKQQSTAALDPSAIQGKKPLESPTMPKLDGAEIGVYRISLARVVHQRALNSSLGRFFGLDGLLLELRFSKPIAAPTVSLIKSSGDPEVDRIYAGLVLEAVGQIAHPTALHPYPYRIELAFWFPDAER